MVEHEDERGLVDLDARRRLVYEVKTADPRLRSAADEAVELAEVLAGIASDLDKATTRSRHLVAAIYRAGDDDLSRDQPRPIQAGIRREEQRLPVMVETLR